MVKLKSPYNRNGYNHELVWRDEEYAVSRLTDDETGSFVCLEAFKIRIKKSGHPNSTAEYPREAVPKDEEWGKYGYTVYTLKQALDKITMMRERALNRKNKIKK